MSNHNAGLMLRLAELVKGIVSPFMTAAAVAIVVVGAVTTMALPAAAVAIKPDRDFAGDGRTALNLPGYNYATDVVVDGSVSYIIGNTPQGDSRRDYRFVVAKYGPGGRLDRSFGDRGRKYVLVGTQSRAFSGALTPDGGVVVAGWSEGRRSASVVIVKLKANGSLDRDFSGDGVTRIEVNRGVEWPLIEVAPDGSIWLAWSSVKDFDYKTHDSDIRVMHFTRSGRVDRGFSGDGMRVFDFRKRDYTYFSDVDSSGRFYVAGYSTPGGKTAGVTSLLSTSARGRSEARTLSPWDNAGSFPLTIDVDASGDLVLGLSPWNKPGWGAARVSPELKLDRTYGNDGFARHDCRCISTAGVLTADGMVLVGNESVDQKQTVLARFSANGRWDGELGNATYNLFPAWESWVEAELDAAGRLVLAGTVKDQDGDLAIARLKMSPI